MGKKPKNIETASIVDAYFDEIKTRYKSGSNATEHTYRPALQNLVEGLLDGVMATNEPQRIKCGAPDFVVTKGNEPIGYIEAKDLDKNLDIEEQSEQIQRYLRSLDNLILTNYLEFRWYVKGQLKHSHKIGKLVNKKIIFIESSQSGLVAFVEAFRNSEIPTIKTAHELAERLAGSTKIIFHLIKNAYEAETKNGFLHERLEAFKTVLLNDLDLDRFADMFAQTLVYGYFSARVNHPDGEDFNRDSASRILPETNPFLRRLFHDFIGLDMPRTIAWAIDEIVQILKRTNMVKVLKDFGANDGKSDPIFHFYETFLTKYNPELKDALGAYYTPKPVIEYIVRSVDNLLVTHFNRPRGIADQNTLILDPATGTGSFLHETIDLIRERMKGQDGGWPKYVSDHLLNRIFGFEIMMAPYAVAHLKVGNQLKETGYKFNTGKRLGVYLTNTLEEAATKTDTLFAKFISDEANEAASVKSDRPIVAVIGNPPYHGSGQNKGEWIKGLMEDYKDGLVEKKSNTNNDYMKFIRFAQWRVDKTGHGIVAFITPNSYTDALTLRQMRSSLLKSFNDIYVFNLHGSARVENKDAVEAKDKPVFDIMEGVAISIFVKKKDSAKPCEVHYSEIFGSREKKYDFLSTHHVGNTEWETLSLSKDRNFFSPTSLKKVAGYEEFISVKDIFPLNNSGIQPKKKDIAIQFTEDEMANVISDLAILPKQEFKSKYGLEGEDSSGWKVEWAQAHAKEILKVGSMPTKIQYRTFDYRWTVIEDYSSGIVGRPRYDTMKHMKRANNIGLVLLRQLSQASFQHAWVSRDPIDENTISRKTKEYNYLFPLFLEPDENQLFTGDQRLNISPKIRAILKNELGMTITAGIHGDFKKTLGPEQLLYYIYATLYSPSYRSKYFSELKIDFPKIPIFKSNELFKKLSLLGEQLSQLHLMEHVSQQNSVIHFPKRGSGLVKHVNFDPETNRLWINDVQYFEGVQLSEWNYKVGGHEPVKEFFTDRVGRELSSEEIETVRKMVVGVSETIRIVNGIDSLIDEYKGWSSVVSANDSLDEISVAKSVTAKRNKKSMSA